MGDLVSPIELPRECIPTPAVEPQIGPTAGRTGGHSGRPGLPGFRGRRLFGMLGEDRGGGSASDVGSVWFDPIVLAVG